MAQLSYSTVNVADGAELGDTAQVIVQEAGRRSVRPSELLLVFIDLPGAAPEALGEIGQAACEAYWRATGSQTAALRDAVARASDAALAINRGAVTRQEGSLTVAVADAHRVVVAQAGPALGFARAASGGFERITPLRLQAPLGQARIEEPEFANFPWQSGDSFVLTGTASCRDVNDHLIFRCMAKGEARLVAGYLNANVKRGRLIGVALTQTDAVAYGAGMAVAARQPAPTPKPATPARPPRETPEPVSASSVVRNPARAAAQGPGLGARIGARLRGLFGSAGATLGAGAGRVGGAARKTLGQVAISMLPETPRAIDAAERSRAAMLGLRAATILLPIAVALIGTLLYFSLSGQAERAQLAESARTLSAQALAEGQDPATQLTRIDAALRKIDEYAQRAPEDKAFAKTREDLVARSDAMRRITRAQPILVYEFATASEERRISASTLGAYVIDRVAGTAEHLVRNAGRPTADPLQLVLPAGATPAVLRDVAWASSIGDRWRTEGAVLFGVDSAYEYRSAENQTFVLRWPSGVFSATSQLGAGELWNGNLYVLDKGVGQIWRLTRGGDGGYGATSYFRQPYGPLTSTVDIAIDGAVFALQANGNVLKYVSSAPATFQPNTPEPIGRSVAIAVSAQDQNRGSVFVADAEHATVWQLGKTGEFQRQYRAPADEMNGMIDLSIDAVNNTVYVLTPKRLLAFKFTP